MAAEDIIRPRPWVSEVRPLRVESDAKYTTLPPSEHEHYKDVTLTADIMFVNAIRFFVSLSRKIKFGTIEA